MFGNLTSIKYCRLNCLLNFLSVLDFVLMTVGKINLLVGSVENYYCPVANSY